jgi:hypothetical protein
MATIRLCLLNSCSVRKLENLNPFCPNMIDFFLFNICAQRPWFAMGNRTKYLQHQTLDSLGFSPWQGVFTNRVMVSLAAIIKQFVFLSRKSLLAFRRQLKIYLCSKDTPVLAYLNVRVNHKESEGSGVVGFDAVLRLVVPVFRDKGC